jgi:hypothetical protein
MPLQIEKGEVDMVILKVEWLRMLRVEWLSG